MDIELYWNTDVLFSILRSKHHPLLLKHKKKNLCKSEHILVYTDTDSGQGKIKHSFKLYKITMRLHKKKRQNYKVLKNG